MQLPSLPFAGGLVRCSTGRPRKKLVSALDGADSAPSGWVAPGLPKLRVGPPRSLERFLGALSPPRWAALHPSTGWGGFQHRREGQHPKGPSLLSLLSAWKVKAGWGPGEVVRGGAQLPFC